MRHPRFFYCFKNITISVTRKTTYSLTTKNTNKMRKKILFPFIAFIFAVFSSQGQVLNGRFDYDSLNSPFTRCTYGTCSNTAGLGRYYNGWSSDSNTYHSGPYFIIGVIDHGPLAYGGAGYNHPPASRHTVHTDPTQTDSITLDSLLCIPQGKTSSVRLGCRYGCYFCQAISYRFGVDTLISDMLVLDLAPVMYNPNHESLTQPRILVELLDQYDSVLGHLDFNVQASQASGSASNIPLTWHVLRDSSYNASTVMGNSYVDWFKVGINIKQYHGQTLYLRITSFNCGQGAGNHYGYVYYTVEYSYSHLTTIPTVAKSNGVTFKAPDGFMSYQWHLNSSPNSVHDTVQIATIPLGETFSCTVTDYFGNSKTLYSKAVPRIPHAQFMYSIVNTCESKKLNLINLSYLTDSTTGTQIGELEDYEWIVDSDHFSFPPNPIYNISPGWHTISLINKSGSTAMCDTMTQRIYIHDSTYITDPDIYDTINAGESYQFGTQTLTTSGTYYDTIQYQPSCFRIKTIHLTVIGEVGFDEADNPEIRIYPNPTVSIVNVEGCEISKVVATDNSGRTVVLPHSSSQVELNALERGIYTLHITTADGRTVLRRLVKK